ncbi:MAG: hypothetical protein M3177_00595 [Pseudomonadota bacterium]|nr:hypothetical protein [Pseudomonadota bacterium]
MFNYDQFVRVATAAVGALILSAISVGAAVGPGHSAATAATVYAMAPAGTQANV